MSDFISTGKNNDFFAICFLAVCQSITGTYQEISDDLKKYGAPMPYPQMARRILDLLLRIPGLALKSRLCFQRGIL